MKKRTIYIGLFLIFIIGVISLIGTFAIDTIITEGNSSKADYLFNIALGDRTNRDILIPSYDSKIVDIKISNPNEFNMSYLLYLEGVNSSISVINISDTDANGVLNSKNTNLVKVFIQNNSGTDITTSIKNLVGFEKETLSLPSNSTAINKGVYYKSIVKSNNNDYGKVKPNIKLSTKNGTVKYNIVPNDGYQYKSTTCEGTVSNNILTISNITSNISCEVVFEPKDITVSLDLAGGKVTTTYTEAKEHTYPVLYNGTYKLETWGAQGGTTIDGTGGGYGGYSQGTITLNSGDILYVNVGGQGSRTSSGTLENIAGGYNGGGLAIGQACCNRSFGSGGGATHIATKSGLLSSLSSNLSDILIVSGGGGGAYYGENVGTYGLRGGSGGGYIGNSGAESTETDNQWCAGLGGTQTAGGAISTNCSKSSDTAGGTITGSFGQGGGNNFATTGGGGGFYGGSRSGHIAPGGGGSGYIGNSKLSNKYMYCYYCATSDATDTKTYTTTNISASATTNYAKSGDGAARVTLISDTNYNVTYNTKYGELPTPTRDGYTFDGWYTGENGTGTKVTSDTLLTNEKDHTLYAKWIKDVKVTFDNNIFSTSSNSMTVNGLSINYDPSTSYLTLNGTPTSAFITLGIIYNLSFVEGEKYALKTTYISGSYSNIDSNWGCFTLDVKNSSNAQVSIRNYADLGFNANYSETVLTINSAGISEGDGFISRLYFDIPSKWTFTNYTVKLDLTKIESKIVKQSQQYGTLPTPTRSGYTFDGWYTGENGTGTKVTSDTVVTNANNHTLYAHWTVKVYTITFNKNGGTGGTDSATITHGTKQGSYPDITLPTMSGYKFIGYYDAASGGTQYYNSTGQSVRDWDKTSNTTLYAHWEASARVPSFTYTGSSQIVDDNDNIISNPSTYIGNWKIRFLTSGTLTFSNSTGLGSGIDIFVVGGGGTGARGGEYIMQSRGGGGGGGGAAITVIKFPATTGKSYSIVIGGNQSNSSFGLSGTAYFTALAGGTPEVPSYSSSGGHVAPVGTGGAGRLSGQTSYYGASNVIVQTGGAGNGSAGNYEFNGSSGKRYGAGGSPGTGGVAQSSGGYSSTPGSGGADGGGKGGAGCSYVNQGRGYSTYGGYDGTAGTANTGSGGGGGGGYCGYSSTSTGTFGWGAAGGSGIVIIRNTR